MKNYVTSPLEMIVLWGIVLKQRLRNMGTILLDIGFLEYFVENNASRSFLNFRILFGQQN